MNLQIGDRVQLVSCAGSPGTVIEQRRGKLLVRFDDLPAVEWLLRSSSLQPVNTATDRRATFGEHSRSQRSAQDDLGAWIDRSF